MKRAYVGIAQQNGLLTLLPERPDVTSFLWRRAERMRAACFWAVIEQSIAPAIIAELEDGARHNALILLQTLAVELGPILAPNESGESCDNRDELILARIA